MLITYSKERDWERTGAEGRATSRYRLLVLPDSPISAEEMRPDPIRVPGSPSVTDWDVCPSAEQGLGNRWSEKKKKALSSQPWVLSNTPHRGSEFGFKKHRLGFFLW